MSDGIALGTTAGRGILAAAILGSGMAGLDSTVVNIALKPIGQDLGASLAQLQWISNGYLLALASLILIGGSLGDQFGRRRVFLWGVVWFTLASLVCGLAQTPEQLIAARIVQGVGAALMTPGSLAMIQGAFRPRDRAKAIGTWSGFGSIAMAVGPFVGGWLIAYATWRWIFFVNLPLAAVTLVVAHRHVPETRNPEAARGFDVVGAVLGALALGGLTFALIEFHSAVPAVVRASAAVGVLAGIAFVVAEKRARHPMMETALFRSRQFSAANAMTLLVYGALGGMGFFLVLQLQTVLGYTPLQAGIATLPMTVVMFLLASRGGALAARIGPRIPMSLGPLVCAAGLALISQIDADSTYWLGVLPGVLVFSLGLALLVAPLTATVLAAAPDRNAGIASGVNNAVARAGSLLAVAALPTLVGLSGADYEQPAMFAAGFEQAMWICVGLLVAGGVVSWLLIRNPPRSLRGSGLADPIDGSSELTDGSTAAN